MAAKTKAQPENLSLFEDDRQTDLPDDIEPEETAPNEILLSSSDPEARELFDLSTQVKDLKPWRWMEETDLIGIEHPETGEIGFISVMGSLGEHEAIALYLGAEGLYDFIDLHTDESATAHRALEIRHVQAAFSERKYLEKEDRDLIKQLGLKFKGGAWPMFRSYRPGYLPWFVTLDEARFLIHALSQIIAVAKSVRDEAQPFHPTGRVEKDGYLMRVSRKEGSALIWEDQVWRIARPQRKAVKAVVDAVNSERLKGLRQSQLELEVDLFLAPASIGKKRGQRPLAVYVLMIADSDSGFIFGTELMSAQDSLPAMHARIPNSLAQMLLQAEIRPQKLVVRSELLRTLLKPFTQALNIELRLQDELPSIDEAAEYMGQFMRGGKL
jgi:hypothetical protein